MLFSPPGLRVASPPSTTLTVEGALREAGLVLGLGTGRWWWLVQCLLLRGTAVSPALDPLMNQLQDLFQSLFLSRSREPRPPNDRSCTGC